MPMIPTSAVAGGGGTATAGGAGAALPIVGGGLAGVALLGGIGGWQQAKANRQLHSGLDSRARGFRDLAEPFGQAIETGASPEGFLRRAMIASAGEPYQQELGRQTTAARGAAWRFGGAGSPMALRRWQDAATAAALGGAGAGQDAELRAEDLLQRYRLGEAGIEDAMTGYTVAENPFTWLSRLAAPVAQGAIQAGIGALVA